MPKIKIEAYDVSHKWADDTKTTVFLRLYDHLDRSTTISYVHTDDTVDEVYKNKSEYKAMLIQAIVDHAEWAEPTELSEATNNHLSNVATGTFILMNTKKGDDK
jgi:hypothetical protein